MFYSMRHLRDFWGIKPTEILHVGAHKAEELEDYLSVGCEHIFWVEAQPACIEDLRTRLNPKVNTVIAGAAWNEDGAELELNIASNSESSSLYDFGTHSKTYPGIRYNKTLVVKSCKLDSVIPKSSRIDFVNLDIQGAELNALKGFSAGIPGIKWIYCEVNAISVYEGCPVILEIDHYLKGFGFNRKSVRWWKNDGWGDAIYIHNSVAIPKGFKIGALRIATQMFWNIKNAIRILLKK